MVDKVAQQTEVQKVNVKPIDEILFQVLSRGDHQP